MAFSSSTGFVRAPREQCLRRRGGTTGLGVLALNLFENALFESIPATKELRVSCGCTILLIFERGKLCRANVVRSLRKTVLRGDSRAVYDGVLRESVVNSFVERLGNGALSSVIVNLHYAVLLKHGKIVKEIIHKFLSHGVRHLHDAVIVVYFESKGDICNRKVPKEDSECGQQTLTRLHRHSAVVVMSIEERGSVERDIGKAEGDRYPLRRDKAGSSDEEREKKTSP